MTDESLDRGIDRRLPDVDNGSMSEFVICLHSRKDGTLRATGCPRPSVRALAGQARCAILRALQQEQTLVFDLSKIRNVSSQRLRELLNQTRGLTRRKDSATTVYLRGQNDCIQAALLKTLIPGVDISAGEGQIVVVIDAWRRAPRRGADIRALIARDGDRCVWCGAVLAADDYQASVDHVLPCSNGGSNSRSNYLLSCYSCNTRRRSVPASKWLKKCLIGGKQADVPAVLGALKRGGFAVPWPSTIAICAATGRVRADMSQRLASR